jgi:squalene synthase HpnC
MRDAPSDATPGTNVPDQALSELERIGSQAQRQITGENFPVALRAVPRSVRDQLVRSYVFARFVDDVGDEAAGDRQALLDLVDQDIQALAAGRASLAPVRGMQPLVRGRGVSIQLLRDLIEANRRDQHVTRYETFDELLDYCRLSAAPIGRIVLAIAAVDDPSTLALSDRVCAALQVLEHCQDVGEDAAAGRFYLPGCDLRAAEVTDDDLSANTTSPALRRVIAVQVSKSAQLLAAGDPLIRRLRGWARLAVLGYVGGGQATIAALKRSEYDVLARHIAPSRLSIARHAALIAVRRPRR